MWAHCPFFLYLYMFFLSTLCSFRTILFSSLIESFHVLRIFKLSEFSPKLNHRTIVPYTILVFCHPSCTSVLSQFSSLTIIYFNLCVRSGLLTVLVPMSANYRPPSHQSILCILHFSPFVKKCILLEMCLVCLVYLPLLGMHHT